VALMDREGESRSGSWGALFLGRDRGRFASRLGKQGLVWRLIRARRHRKRSARLVKAAMVDYSVFCATPFSQPAVMVGKLGGRFAKTSLLLVEVIHLDSPRPYGNRHGRQISEVTQFFY